MLPCPLGSSLFPYTTLFRSELTGTARDVVLAASVLGTRFRRDVLAGLAGLEPGELAGALAAGRDTSLLQLAEDRKSTRLNSSHPSISYAVFCLKKKNLYVLK